MTLLIVGADVGGTSTRAAVADLDGRLLGTATGGPGNPNAVGLEESAARIRSVVAGALEGIAGTVAAWVLGLAGGSRAQADTGFAATVRPAGVEPAPHIVPDLNVAFSSATPVDQGYVLIAGTGSVAGRIQGFGTTDVRDGLGWLLGDAGSGYWLGREAVRRTLHSMQRGEPASPLGRAVLDRAGTPGLGALVAAAYANHPTWLAGFAPLVTAHVADSADAADIVAEAADQLAGLLLDLRPEPGLPAVLAGSLLTAAPAVGERVRHRLATSLDNPVLTATEGVLGALWLGLRELGVHDPAVHARLLRSAAERRRA